MDKQIRFVNSVTEARDVISRGYLPAVNVSSIGGAFLSHELVSTGIPQATMSQIMESGVRP